MTALLGGRYVLEERLGGGGMAEVFRGRAHGVAGFEKAVAIKRVLPGLAGDPRFAELFVAEAKLTSRLDHRNIVTVLDFDRDEDGRHFLVMELVLGASLDRLLATGPLSFPVVAHIAGELLRGLGYAHDASQGHDAVIHRDVSPHNVLLSWQGEVKLSDFGVAKLRAATQATASESIKGKPAYMSPEQANGEALDGRSDLFAAGAVLWEMLAGRELFSGATTQETLARLLFAPIPSPRELRPEVPEDLARVAMRLLARERDARYLDAAAALAELDACRDRPPGGEALLAALLGERLGERAPKLDRPPPARLPGPLDAARARRGRTAVVVTALAVGGVAIGLAVGLRMRAPAGEGGVGDAAVEARDAAGAGDAVVVVAEPADAAPAVPPPAPDAARVVAPPVDPREAHRRAIERQMKGETTPVAVPQPAALDPYAFYARARAEAEHVLGKAALVSVNWRNFDRRGRIDTTAAGGYAEYFFVAQDPALTGEYCIAWVAVERGRGTLVLERPDGGGTCPRAMAPPACTMAELWQRAMERGLPADAQQASVQRIGNNWSFVIGAVSEQFKNDCH